MKKVLVVVVMLFSAAVVHAQYRPTQADVGNDCTTQDGKIGTWKNVTVEDNSYNGQSSSNKFSGSISASAGYKGVVEGKISGTAAHENSKTSGSSETLKYEDIRCVEDKNATLPQRSPARW